jgi:hypothetical protein
MASQSQAAAADKLSCIKQLVDLGELDLAEAAAKSISTSDPCYRGAQYYISIISNARQHLALRASQAPKPKVWIPTIPPQPIY